MRRSALFSLAALAALAPAGYPQDAIRRVGDRWEGVFTGAARVGPRLQVRAHGSVTLEAGAAGELVYTARVSVRAANEAHARRLLQGYAIQISSGDGWSLLRVPGGQSITRLSVKAPKLTAASISTTDGAVEAYGVDGPIEIDSGAGPLTVDRIAGDARLMTRGGDIRAGSLGGLLQATTGAGQIAARQVRGEAVLRTIGGDIVAEEVGGPVRAETGAGTVRVEKAWATVNAITGGGQIWIGSARGVVTARNMAGLVHIGSAAGVSCSSGGGAIRLGPISGAMQVSTTMGSIVATMLGKAADSFLTTGNGDITVLIPSNVGVTILAENEMADSLRRIASDFPQVQVRRQGTRLVAEGQVNGGGPVLRMTAAIGTIFIKRQ